MFKKKRETDTLTQQRTRQYVKMMLGAYLIYTAYSMGRDLHQGIQADNPALIIAIAAVFALFGLFCRTLMSDVSTVNNWYLSY